MLSVIVLSAVMLSVVIPIVVMLSVVAHYNALAEDRTRFLINSRLFTLTLPLSQVSIWVNPILVLNEMKRSLN
jgi:hypothetical protein